MGIAQARAITVFCLLVPQLIVTSSWCLTVAWGPLPAAPAPLCDGTFQILCILKTFPALSKMLYMYICKPCAASDPLAPESQAVVWVLGTELQPLQEQPVLLITEPFLQNQPSFYSLKVIMFESPACVLKEFCILLSFIDIEGLLINCSSRPLGPRQTSS